MYTMEKKLIGQIYQQGGIRGEIIINNALKRLGYITDLAKTNQEGYDLIAIKGRLKYLIQVKTDMNGDGRYPTMTREQIDFIKSESKKKGGEPVLVHYDPHNNKYNAQYINTGEDCVF